MAPAGRGALRPYQPSKFQPFLIVCLLVTVVIVGYNFWNQMKKNSALLVEIGRIQATLGRIESERKDCTIQLASMEEERRQHEVADKKKENTLEDTRRLVEDLKSEKDLLKQNISKLLSQITDSELKEDKLRSECDQRCEAMRTEAQNTCNREKGKIQQEMNDQLGVMRSQLLQQHQETENPDQKLQRQKEEAGSDTAVRRGDSTTQPEQQVPVQQQQQQPLGQRYRKSRLGNNPLGRGKLAGNRLHGRQIEEILAHRSKDARASSSQNELLGRRGNDEVIYSKQTSTEEISAIDRQRRLSRENENGDSQKGERETVGGTERLRVVAGGSAPDDEDPVPGQNSELSEGKRPKLSMAGDASTF